LAILVIVGIAEIVVSKAHPMVTIGMLKMVKKQSKMPNEGMPAEMMHLLPPMARRVMKQPPLCG